MSIINFFKNKQTAKQGEVTALGESHTNNRVDIYKFKLDDGSIGIELNVVSKGFLSYQSLPLSLNEEQARELVSIISETLNN